MLVGLIMTVCTQDYPSFYITGSKYDWIVPFKGVKRFAKRLEECVKLHRSRSSATTTELENQGRDAPRGGSHKGMNAIGVQSKKGNCGKVFDRWDRRHGVGKGWSLRRGTVLFRKLGAEGHSDSNDIITKCNEVIQIAPIFIGN